MKIYESRYRLNRIFLRLHKGLFSLFVLGAAGTATVFCIVDGTLESALHWLKCSGVAYVCLACVTELAHLLLSFPFRVLLYYQVWLKRIVPRLQAIAGAPKPCLSWIATRILGRQDPNTFLVMKSAQGAVKGRPLLVRREDLTAKWFWPDWAFSIVMLFNTILMTRMKMGARRVTTIHIDLMDQSFGIYNNAGKDFLRKEWGRNPGFRDRCAAMSDSFMKFMAKPRESSRTLSCAAMPLRWASGGFLPLVRTQDGHEWIALFFRDLRPVGWNVANGASESKGEYKDLEVLIAREFAEEMLILECEPERARYCLEFDFPDADKNDLVRTFATKHRSLRLSQDGINVQPAADRRIRVRLLPTPFRLSVRYHSGTFEEMHNEVRDVLFLVNPFEFGIEILQVCEFELPQEACLLDGEIWTQSKLDCLVRRPVALFRVEMLRQVFGQGELIPVEGVDDWHLECRRIARKLSRADFRLFSADVHYKKRRLEQLREAGDKARGFEVDRWQMWLDRFGWQFEFAMDGGELDPDHTPDLLSLCPVTWKALECVFKHRII